MQTPAVPLQAHHAPSWRKDVGIEKVEGTKIRRVRVAKKRVVMMDGCNRVRL